MAQEPEAVVELPFPGMDPYLDAPSLWPDVHHRLITVLCDQIQAQLSPRYTAVITPYVAFESLEIAPIRLAAVPDTGVLEYGAPLNQSSSIAIAPPTTALMEVPTRYARLEVRTVGDETLVTAVELLSPVNKRPGVEGADAYERKRQELFRSDAHLLEIDLLRTGRRPQVAGTLPDEPYFVLLSRAERRPRIEVWPITLRMAIPGIPVPLRRPDSDVGIDLTAALRHIYRNARYERRVDYNAPPPPPDLPPQDAAWLDSHLRERSLRP